MSAASERFPRLVARARLRYCPVRRAHLALWPEALLALNRSAFEVLSRCDGARSEAALVDELTARFPAAPIARDVPALLARMTERGLLEAPARPTPRERPLLDPAPAPAPAPSASASPREGGPDEPAVPPPDALLAELTYRCPLRCGYCSNPLDLAAHRDALDEAQWRAVLDDAARLGALHAHFSGGEPLLREDLAALVRHARGAGLYTNLITSGYGLTARRADELVEAGLDHAQLSVQHVDEARADAIAGVRAHAQKLVAARLLTERSIALSVNVVLHRESVDATAELIELAVSLGAVRVELANAQYHGWALRNRAALLPTREQLARAHEAALAARAKYQGQCDVLFVLPDYYTGLPRPCMDGWGKRFATVTPSGLALPCPGAHELPLPFASVLREPLSSQWRAGAVFTAYRGEAWMREPCASCDRRASDYGGCRCQAFALTGDARSTDPACHKSPHHALVLAARDDAQKPAPLVTLRTRSARAARGPAVR